MEVHRVGGRNCIDAASGIELEITEQDTKLANRRDLANCVMARACMKQEGTDAIVSKTRVYLKVKDKDLWVRYGARKVLTREIKSFDQHGTFKPGIYKLHALQPCKKLGADPRKRPNDNTCKKNKRVPVILHDVRPNAGNYFGNQNAKK